MDAGRLLMVRRGRAPAAGMWSIPGGRVEQGETLAEAVVREVAEETGVEAVCEGLAGWVEHTGPHHHFVILDFWVRALAGAEPRPGGDAAEAAWVPLGEVRELALVDGLDKFLTERGVLEGPPGVSVREGY